MSIPLVLTLALITPISTASLQETEQVVVRGRIISLDKGASFGLKGEDGHLYGFSADDLMAAMFTDPQVRSRQLQITARLHPAKRLEVIKVQSILNGMLYDLYYYCELCNITAYAPGPCPCCRKELEFKETPAEQH
ncbi:MAG TPA: hypothetical protein VNO14_03505 [Blastocatellia bacterium]|nr:hypothetical protein [Blastocatellia bacterium]